MKLARTYLVAIFATLTLLVFDVAARRRNIVFSSSSGETLGKITRARNSAELVQALAFAKPGDTIQLLPIVYEGNFILPGKGGGAPIKIDGHPNPRSRKSAKLMGNGGTVVDIKGGRWILQSLEILGGNTGVSANGDGHQFTTLTVSGFSNQGMALKGSFNRLTTVNVDGGQTGIQVDGRQNSLTTITVRGSQNGIIVNGEGNRLTTITTEDIQDTGVLIGKGSRNVQGTTITAEGGKYGLFISQGASEGRYTTLTVKQGLLQIEGGNNAFTTTTVHSGANILTCGNSFVTCTISRLYQAQQCNNMAKYTSTINQISSSPIPVGSYDDDDDDDDTTSQGGSDYESDDDGDVWIGNMTF